MELDLATATAADLTDAIRRRELSSRELLDHLLTRAEQFNPDLNAIVAWDTERAREAAAAADDATARRAQTGPLHGLPMTVKDVWETEGVVTTSGAPELAHYMPTADALAVRRLKDAGAIIFGKTNTPMYAGDWQTYNDVYGRTNNPWDLSRTVGGSSGGAAAAVAAGLTPLELGSDIGGSIRVPAHYNGTYGLKPSWGVVPVRGHIPGPPGSLITVDVGVAGPLARSVADLRSGLTVVAGPLPEDAAGWRLELDEGPLIAGPAGLRIAVTFADGTEVLPLSTDVRGCLDQFAGRLADAGAQVDAVPLPVPLADGFRTWQDITMPILGLGLPDTEYSAFAELDNAPGDDPALVALRAMASRYRTVLSATEVRQRQRAAWAEFFENYDAVLAPVMPTPAYAHDTDQPLAERMVDVDGVAIPYFLAGAWCCAVGSALLPAVTLPVGPGKAGLPVGIQVVGPFLSDLRLLRIAEVLDAAAGPGFTAPALS